MVENSKKRQSTEGSKYWNIMLKLQADYVTTIRIALFSCISSYRMSRYWYRFCSVSHLPVRPLVHLSGVLWKNGWLDLDAIWVVAFGVVGWLGPRMRQVVGVSDCSTARGNFEGDVGCPILTNGGLCGILVRTCVNQPSCCLGWWVGSAKALVY